MAAVLNMTRLQRLRRAVRQGRIEDETGRQGAQLMMSIIQQSWSGYYPPASTPGEPPAIRTGRLKNSGKIEQDGRVFRVLFTAPYAKHLEYGTHKMAPRPFMAPAAEEVRRVIARLAREATLNVIGDS